MEPDRLKSRVLFAWEMGGNLGHIARDLPLAIACREAGHDVLFAVKDLSVCVDAAREFGIDFVQAPVLRSKQVRPGSPGAINYADLLWQTGFCDARALESVLLGWQGLFDAFKPDAMVCDFAPRALLAARLASIPAMLLGNGFETPPRVSPLPSFRPRQDVPEQALLEAERRVVNRINGVLTQGGKPRIDKLWQLFADSPLLIAYFPEFDHFGPRAEAQYVGMASRLPLRAQDVAWKTTAGTRIVAYLQPDLDGIEHIFAALNELDAEVVCIVPDMPAEWIDRHDSLRFFDKPVDLGALLPHANLAITHGSGTVAEAIAAGVPVLVVPAVTEQFLAGIRIERQGLGLTLRKRRSAEDCLAVIRRLISDERFRMATRELAGRRAGMCGQASVSRQFAVLRDMVRERCS